MIKKNQPEEESGLRSYCMQMTSLFIAQFPSVDTTSHTHASLKFIALILCIMRVETLLPSKKWLQKLLSCCFSLLGAAGARIMTYFASCQLLHLTSLSLHCALVHLLPYCCTLVLRMQSFHIHSLYLTSPGF